MASEGIATRQASADGESGVHRLRDIVVEEVSLVDRAANKRRFLVVKRSSEMADGKSKDGAKPAGGPTGAGQRAAGKKPQPKPDEDVDKARPRVTRAASDEDGEDEDEEDTEKARGSRSAEDKDEDDEEEDEVDAEKAEAEEDEDDEEEEEDDEDDAKANKTGPRAKADPDAEGDAAGEPQDVVLPPAAKTAVLRVLAQALERLMAVANRVKEADAPDDEANASVPDDLTAELEDIGELLEDVGEQLADPAAKAADKRPGTAKAVTKAGRRMAKDRLDRFQKALEALSSILKELTNAKELPEPAAGARAKPVGKRDTAPGLGELVVSVRELTGIVKRQEEELTRMQKTRATSNAIPVDGGGRRRTVQDVSWPLDMNRPITRDRVDKAISFYDEE